MSLTKVIVGTVFAAASIAAWAAPVGRVILASGSTVAVRDGREIRLAFGSPIEAKDVLRTGPASSLQVSFSDQSIKSIRENSELAVDEYHFTGAEDGTEKAIFRLIKGGFRAVTGLIGRARPADYAVRTQSATIGIRGTDYAVRNCSGDCGADVKDGLYGSVLGLSHGTNQITLTNKAGEFAFGINQHFYVSDASSAPQPLLQPPSFVAVKPQGQAQAQAGGSGTGEEVAAAGTGIVAESRPTLVTETVTQVATGTSEVVTPYQAAQDSTQPEPFPLSPPPPAIGGDGVFPTGSLFFMSAEYNTGSGAHNAFNTTSGSITTDASGILTAAGGQYQRNDAQAMESGADGGVIAWTRWTNGTPLLSGWGNQVLTADQGFHIMTGVPATSLPSQDGVSFSLIGATRPTETRAGALGGWSVTSGSLTANFLAANLTGNLGLSLSRTGEAGTFAMNFSGSASTGSNSLSSTVTRTAGTAALCVTACSGSGTLMFAGATTATHAGMIYEFNAGSYFVQGAAAFKR